MQLDVMFRRDVERIRKSSRSADSGPWVSHYEEMAKKTVVRRLAKYLPASTEKMHRLVELDEQAEAGIPQDLALPSIEVAEEPDVQPASKLDAIVARARKPKEAPANPESAGSEPELPLEREPGCDDA